MRLDVCHFQSRAFRRVLRLHKARDTDQGPRLEGNQVADLVQRHWYHSPPEAWLVIVARMGTNAHTAGSSTLQDFRHDVSVTSVATARQICRGHDLQQFSIGSHRPWTKSFG